MRLHATKLVEPFSKETWERLKELHAAFLEELWRREPPPPAPTVAKQSVILSDRYNRLSPTLTYGRPDLLGARLHFFMPTDMAKVWVPLAEALQDRKLEKRKLMRILDLGAGVGTASVGAILLLSALGYKGELEVYLLEPDLVCSEKLPLTLSVAAHVTGLKVHFERLDWSINELLKLDTSKRFTIVVLLNVVVELFNQEEYVSKATDLLLTLLDKFVAKDGLLLYIEPALKKFARLVSLVGDRLRDRGIQIFAPCMCTGKCPETERSDTFCFHSIDVPLLPYLQSVSSRSALARHEVNYSYLTIRKDGKTLAEVLGLEGKVGRIISFPKRVKKGYMFFICTKDGLGNMFVPRVFEPGHIKAKNLLHGTMATYVDSAEWKKLKAERQQEEKAV